MAVIENTNHNNNQKLFYYSFQTFDDYQFSLKLENRAMATRYNLGFLVGGRICQYADSTGSVYYHDTVAGTTSYTVPQGFADAAGVRFFLASGLLNVYEFIKSLIAE